MPLAKPGDDVKPEDFVCFRFDGAKGLYIHPNVWHEGVFSRRAARSGSSTGRGPSTRASRSTSRASSTACWRRTSARATDNGSVGREDAHTSFASRVTIAGIGRGRVVQYGRPGGGDAMANPFPGMDPYLEGPFWQSVHANLATDFVRYLTPRLRPKYVAVTTERIVLVGSDDEGEQPQFPMSELSRTVRRPAVRHARAAHRWLPTRSMSSRCRSLPSKSVTQRIGGS